MEIMRASLFFIFLFSSSFLNAVCTKCEIIRQNRIDNPEPQFEYYEDYLQQCPAEDALVPDPDAP